MRDSKRLASIFRSLSEPRQQALLDYAEFLAGKEGAEVARRHIISDLKEEDPTNDHVDIPLDEEDYVKKGYF